MRIAFFRDLEEEHWFSMNRYSDALATELKIKKSASGDSENLEKLKIDEFVVPRQDITPSEAFNLYYTRYLYYPLKARGQQGEVNHVVDHSYGHLVYALDPQRTVVTCHDLNPLKYEESWLNLRLFKYSIGGLKRAAKIISDSEATKKDLIKFLKIDPSKIVVIPLGVEEKFRVIDDQEELDRVRGKFNLPHDRKVLMHVGGSAYNKNIEGIIKVISNLKSQSATGGSNVFFIKIGSSSTDVQKGLIREFGLQDSVKFLGEVSEEDLVVLYNLADVFVFPSFYEGFGLPVLEAMACGTPVVTSNTSSLPEVAGEAAILVDPYNVDAIASALTKVLHFHTLEYGKYEGMVRGGLEQAKKFTWQKTAEETLQLYEEVYKESMSF